jgi:ubiquinone/menaquinone biosynthesis C-methylase UbiE
MGKEKLKTSFGKLSGTYDEVRPDYPEELVNDVIQISSVPSSGRILEIGTGTGKATRPFAERGYEITALDISGEQMAIARRNLLQFSTIKYMVSAFEQADLPANGFDLVFAAQTFHWINPEIGYKKVAEVLKENGYLAFFSNFQARNAELEQQVRKLYTKHCPDYPGADEYGTLRTLQEQFEGSGLFGNVERKTYMRDIEYTREKYLGLVSSFSWVSTLPEDKKVQFFRELEGIIKDNKILSVPTESILLIAKKK